MIYYGVSELAHTGDEATATRFTLDKDGNVSDVNNRPISLVQEVKAQK